MLQTERLTLEPMGLSDSDDLYTAVVSQDSVMRWLSFGHAGSREAATEMCLAHAAHWSRHGYGDYAVRATRSREFLGRVGLRDRPEFGVDLGFALSPAAQGRGIAAEAGRACLDLAFDQLGLPEVWAFALPGNERSIALLRRLGAQAAGCVVSSGHPCLRFRFQPNPAGQPGAPNPDRPA